MRREGVEGGATQQKPQTHFGTSSAIAFTSKSHYTMFTGIFRAKGHRYKKKTRIGQACYIIDRS